jgi:methionyl-tRNA formyltransferase
MKVCCVGYRDWALKIYSSLENEFDTLVISSKKEYNEETIRKYNPDYVLFYGWSWIIDKKLLEDYTCIMLHPSPLPKYRGGSPIQNQIINGEKDSAVSLFIMDQGIDTGDLIAQEHLSLEGQLFDILDRITQIGTRLTLSFLKNGFTRLKQVEAQATFFPRRKVSENEITIEELLNKNGEYLYNKIRMLQDPYPNSYIKTIDGKKLKLKLVELE